MTRTVLSGGQVFDAHSGTISAGDVAVEDDRIADVGSGLDGDEQVDVSGRTLLPGLFDCHTHVMISHVDIWKMLQRPFSLVFYETEQNLRATLTSGSPPFATREGPTSG